MAAIFDLTDKLPTKVRFAVPRGQRPPRIDHPPTTVFRFDRKKLDLGVAAIEDAPGELVRVYSAGRTLVDLVRIRRRLGESLAYTAIQRYPHAFGCDPCIYAVWGDRRLRETLRRW